MKRSMEASEIFYKPLIWQSALDIDTEPFNGNVLHCHYFMGLFNNTVVKNVHDSRDRLTWLIHSPQRT